MPDYILRDIDPALWKKCKAQAAREGRPLRWVLIRALEIYAKGGLEKLEEAIK